MFDHLQIYEPRERWLVGVADVVLSPMRLIPRRRAKPPQRVLLLRLERIGDLLMILDAIRLVRHVLPDARIDLVVGSWNAPLARLISEVSNVEIADAPWLARGGSASWGQLSEQTREWRGQYDLVINFEPDIRSNMLAWLTLARRRVGYWTGGGGAFLTDAYAYDPQRHVADNARELVAHALELDLPAISAARRPDAHLAVPADARERAAALLGQSAELLVGMHVSGGRESKQWHLDRFAAVATQLARERRATIVLTGAESDRPLVDQVRRELADVSVIDACGAMDLPTLAGLLQHLAVLVTGDTGPMHLAAAMGTPVVALFGPSDPKRYGPLIEASAILRVDLPCSPCGQVRLPPERCRGHVPDCMDGITVERVVRATIALLDRAETSAR